MINMLEILYEGNTQEKLSALWKSEDGGTANKRRNDGVCSVASRIWLCKILSYGRQNSSCWRTEFKSETVNYHLLSLFVVTYMVSHIFFIGYGSKNLLVRVRSTGNLFHPSRQAEPAVPAAVTSPSIWPYGNMRQPLDGLAPCSQAWYATLLNLINLTFWTHLILGKKSDLFLLKASFSILRVKSNSIKSTHNESLWA